MEDYSKWSIEKFRRLCERFMESSHMAANIETYRMLNGCLMMMLQQFETLHPRAYRNWQRDLQNR
jgi:hypothetical protein